MLVESVQVAKPKAIAVSGQIVQTGLFKLSADSIQLETGGVSGDSVVNTKHHGGPGQAVYVYTRADYSHWEQELGRALPCGWFGENITIDTVDQAKGPLGTELRVGDRFIFGPEPQATDQAAWRPEIELTTCRIPCDTFAAHMADPDWIATFRAARRPGFYARVIQPGTVKTGDPVRRICASPRNVTMLETQDMFYADPADVPTEWLQAALASPVAERNRADYVGQLVRRGVKPVWALPR